MLVDPAMPRQCLKKNKTQQVICYAMINVTMSELDMAKEYAGVRDRNTASSLDQGKTEGVAGPLGGDSNAVCG